MPDFFRPRDFVHRPKLGKREHLTVTNAVKQLTSSAYKIAEAGTLSGTFGTQAKFPTAAVIQVLAQPLNFTTEGTDPTTTTVGFVAIAKDVIYLNTTQEIINFKAIRNTGTDAEIEVQYFYGF